MNPDIALSSLTLAVSLGGLQSVIIGIAGFLAAFGLAVFIHELGHFLAAKAFGVPVERFVIGFDKEAMPFLPRCIIERKIGETVYGLSLVPLGGYVKMSGVVHPEIERYLEGTDRPAPSHPTDIDAAIPVPVHRHDGEANPVTLPASNTLSGQAMQDMDALYKKPFWQKTIIYCAGVTMNLLLAMALITIIYTRGFIDNAPLETKVAWIKPGSSFEKSGIAVGDRVVSVDGAPVADDRGLTDVFKRLEKAMADKQPSISLKLGMQRPDASAYELPVQIGTNEGDVEDFSTTFIYFPPIIDGVILNDPADRAGVKDGDLVASINGQPIVHWMQVRDAIRASPGKQMAITVMRDGAPVDLTVTPREDPSNAGRGQIGVVPGNTKKVFTQEPFLVAAGNSPARIINRTVMYVQNLQGLVRKLAGGQISAVRRELGGPVGIAQLAYRQSQNGLNDWLGFVVMLNVALAVMNILPIPVLDGGHVCFAAYEGIFRRPVPARVLVPVLNGAVTFFLIFFVLVTLSDVLKIFH
ncbi:RIP metalloprotease RseP [soil metagenome]